MSDQATQRFGSSDEVGWPLLPAERIWGPWKLLAVGVVIAAATWCYILGEYVGYYLGLGLGFSAMMVGTMVGMLLVFLAVAPVCTRYGIDSIASTKPTFGNRGYLITVAVQFVWVGCWVNILIVYFAKAAFELCVVLGIVGEADAHATVAAFSILGCLVTALTLLRGANGIQRISSVLFVFVVLVGAWLVYMLLSHHSEALATAEPAYASPLASWNYVTGVEIFIITYLGWWPFLGAIFRVVPGGGTSVVPGMIGLSLPGPGLAVIGLAAILALGVSDPAKWMVALGGPFYGGIVLVFVIVANLGTAMLSVYAMGLGLRQVPGLDKLSWRAILAICLVPVAVLAVINPDLLFSQFFGTFLAFMGALLAPIVAIQLVDYMILRRQNLDIRALYDRSPNSPYGFHGGFNVAAIASFVIGFVVYTYLLNPVTYASNSPYEYLTASLPTVLVTGVVYYVLSRAVNVPTGRGAYPGR